MVSKGDDKQMPANANKLELASNSHKNLCNLAQISSGRHFCMGFSISEVILSVEEGIMGETKSFLTLISKTAHLYLCQLFFGGACSLKQSLAQYFFL